MISESTIQLLIYLHAGLGGLALSSGLGSILAKKGGKWHRTAGKVFYYSMLNAAFSALVIAVLPGHKSPFLFAIGIFSSYFVIAGYRALTFKFKNPNLFWDKVLAWLLLTCSVLMISLPIILNHSIHIVLTVFGIFGVFSALRDLWLYRSVAELSKNYLSNHLGKMLGGYIAATTAFVVVNAFFPSFYGWFIPGIIGGFLIAYWVKKVKANSWNS